MLQIPHIKSAWKRLSVPAHQKSSYLCNYISIFSMNLSYGTQLSQAAEYLIQLKQKQEKAITTKAHYPGLHTTLKLLALCPSAESCSRDRVRTGWRIWCQPHKNHGHARQFLQEATCPQLMLPVIPHTPLCLPSSKQEHGQYAAHGGSQLHSRGAAKARTSEGSRDKQRGACKPL